MAPKDRAPASTMDRAGIYVDRGRTSPEQALAARIKALGVTPEQVRAWAEREGILLPRYGVDRLVVTEYEHAHPDATPIPPVTEPEEPPCPTPTPGATSAPTAPALSRPRRSRSAATGTSPTPSSAPAPPTPATSTATASATSGPAPSSTPKPAEPGPTTQGARRAAQLAAVPTLVSGEHARTGTLTSNPTRTTITPTTTPTSTAPSTRPPAIDIPTALAAARRLGATGAGARAVVRRLVELGAHLNDRLTTGGPWTCHVCQQPVAGEHVARTGRAVHGDPATLSGCYAAHTGRKTA